MNKQNIANTIALFIIFPVLCISMISIVWIVFFDSEFQYQPDVFLKLMQLAPFIISLLVFFLILLILAWPEYCPKCGDTSTRRLIDEKTINTTPETKSGDKDLRYNETFETEDTYEHTCKNKQCNHVFIKKIRSTS